ncbi:hypothetical protein C5C99_05400 [Rathayibacter sp. AY1C4]|nr:hypothetical protein C5C99_05400 [Rathayibacter sp. AY1C4]
MATFQELQKVLAEDAPTPGVAVKLQTFTRFRFGPESFGARLTIRNGDAEFRDRITGVQIKVTREDGVTATPAMGKRQNDPSHALLDVVVALADSTRAQKRL